MKKEHAPTYVLCAHFPPRQNPRRRRKRGTCFFGFLVQSVRSAFSSACPIHGPLCNRQQVSTTKARDNKRKRKAHAKTRDDTTQKHANLNFPTFLQKVKSGGQIPRGRQQSPQLSSVPNQKFGRMMSVASPRMQQPTPSLKCNAHPHQNKLHTHTCTGDLSTHPTPCGSQRTTRSFL